ncbi:MAG: anaerobic nitric oxide reductase flavorubredoxin [Chitinispirillaceae bacterium]|nr:anaerobic nitric oxide reductase flavorubredoxin [Chitinispirillaceae bacterium]
MSFKVKNNVYWVGKTDWELRNFHGNEYSTHRGSTYNSFLVREDKVALIDTVWQPFAGEFVDLLSKEIPLEKIDVIIANHAEIDHSGALDELMKRIPGKPVYCTTNGVKSLKGHYHRNWNFQVVKTGDRLSLGSKELIFIEAPMLHWPDSMMCYLTGDNILFSNDAFGQHYASEFMYNDLVDQSELFTECMKYYANILTPFSAFVTKKIQEVLSFELPVDLICPSHGVLWRDRPIQIVEKYLAWADNYRENQITIIYDTMWNSTRIMAENFVAGIREADTSVNVKLFNIAHSDKNDVVTEVFKSKGVVFGSPTINRGILTAMAGFLEEIRGLGFKDKKAAVFGSYGWSGESVKMLHDALDSAGWEVVNDGLKTLWNPDDESIGKCVAFGKDICSNFK